ncbi:MAG: GGDEF domain-containing protein [Clostridiales bacterium]|nr:GGDEF domain-containing protein [Clostridiales bacterium]
MRLCVFIGDMYRDFALSVLKQLDSYALEKGYHIDVFGTCSVPTTNPLHVIGFRSILSLPDIDSYDGILVCYDTLVHEGMARDLIKDITQDKNAPPLVCIRSGIPGVHCVLPDNRKLMHDIAAHVISKCHSADIGFITGNLEMPDSYERWDGFKDAMKEAGYEASDSLTFHGNYWITQAVETADFFTKPDGTLPEAIICSNDYEAIALCNELTKRGFSIPGDTMVSGVDNTFEGMNHIPSLTTIEIAKSDFVDAAIDAVKAMREGKDIDINIPVPAQVILRESTGDSTEQRDVYKTLCKLTADSSASMDDMREFVVLNALFDGALTMDAVIQTALEQFKEMPPIRSCFICRYRENDHELVGHFKDRGECVVENVPFPVDRILPEKLNCDGAGMYVGFSLTYKNEVYGYVLMEFDTEDYHFINFKTEYLLTIVGHSIKKLELYEKLFGISDVISLYSKDPMTGMFNRRGFEKNISEKFDKEGKPIHNLMIVSLDMDELKLINDNYGHLAGDKAIKDLADCISAALKSNEFAARMGGDEFTAIIDTTDTKRTGQFIRAVRDNLKEKNQSGENPFELSTSIGTCEITEWSLLMDSLNKADRAMYLEKRSKRKNR